MKFTKYNKNLNLQIHTFPRKFQIISMNSPNILIGS